MASMNATGAADAMLGTPMHEAYVSRAPQPEDWPILVAKLGQLLREDYDWADDVTAIEAPTLVIVGDADSVRPTHAVELFQLLGGGVPGDFAGLPNAQLAVLPGTTHFGVLARSDLLLPILTAFLDAPMREGR
jgi:pimeloyl-ACP methyl ester carboxylesterase